MVDLDLDLGRKGVWLLLRLCFEGKDDEGIENNRNFSKCLMGFELYELINEVLENFFFFFFFWEYERDCCCVLMKMKE